MAILRCLNGKFIPKTDSLFLSSGDVFNIESFSYKKDLSGNSFTITVSSEDYLLKDYFTAWMMSMYDKDYAMLPKENIIDTLLISDPEHGIEETLALDCIPVELGEGELIFRADWINVKFI